MDLHREHHLLSDLALEDLEVLVNVNESPLDPLLGVTGSHGNHDTRARRQHQPHPCPTHHLVPVLEVLVAAVLGRWTLPSSVLLLSVVGGGEGKLLLDFSICVFKIIWRRKRNSQCRT